MDFEKETPTNNEKTWAYYKCGRSGSFATVLCRAWELGDLDNKARLEAAFPRLFGTALIWMYSDHPDEFIEKILDKE